MSKVEAEIFTTTPCYPCGETTEAWHFKVHEGADTCLQRAAYFTAERRDVGDHDGHVVGSRPDDRHAQLEGAPQSLPFLFTQPHWKRIGSGAGAHEIASSQQRWSVG